MQGKEGKVERFLSQCAQEAQTTSAADPTLKVHSTHKINTGHKN